MAFDSEGLAIVDGGSWSISYQKRVIDASMWVDEVVDEDVVAGLAKNPVVFFNSLGACIIHRLRSCCYWWKK